MIVVFVDRLLEEPSTPAAEIFREGVRHVVVRVVHCFVRLVLLRRDRRQFLQHSSIKLP